MLTENLYKLGGKLGLNKNDIDDVLKYETLCNEYVSLLQPVSYKDGTWYGTISINDF